MILSVDYLGGGKWAPCEDGWCIDDREFKATKSAYKALVVYARETYQKTLPPYSEEMFRV